MCSCITTRGGEGKKRRISFVCKAEQPEEVKERREGYHSCVVAEQPEEVKERREGYHSCVVAE